MQIYLFWYLLAIASLIVGIILGAIAYSNDDDSGNDLLRNLYGAGYFFLAAIALGVLGVIEQKRNAWAHWRKQQECAEKEMGDMAMDSGVARPNGMY